jgi:hypothetical protein
MTTVRIRRMDRVTRAQWDESGRVSVGVDRALSERVHSLLRMLDDMDEGFAVDQLGHALQTATRAERAGAERRNRWGHEPWFDMAERFGASTT